MAAGWKDVLNTLVPDTDPHILLLAERVGQGKRQVEALEMIAGEVQLIRQAVERAVLHLTQQSPAEWPATLEQAEGEASTGVGEVVTMVPQDPEFYVKAQEVREKLAVAWGRTPTEDEVLEVVLVEYPRAES